MSLPIPNCRERAGDEGGSSMATHAWYFLPQCQQLKFPTYLGGVLHVSFLLGKSLLPCCLQDQFRLNLVCLSWYKMPQVLSGSNSRRDTQNCVRRLPGLSLGVCGEEVEGLTLSFFKSRKHRSPLTGSMAPSEAAVPKTTLVFSAGTGADGRWSPAQAWKSRSPRSPQIRNPCGPYDSLCSHREGRPWSRMPVDLGNAAFCHLEAFQISKENERWIRCYWNHVFLQEESCQFLEEWQGKWGERGEEEMEKEENGAKTGKERKTGRRKAVNEEGLSLPSGAICFLLCLDPCTSELHTLPSWSRLQYFPNLLTHVYVGKIPGGGHGNPLQYSCLENSMDRGAWGCWSPWGHKELDMTKWQTLSLLPSYQLGQINSLLTVLPWFPLNWDQDWTPSPRTSRSHFQPHSLHTLYTSRHPELQPNSVTGCDFS